MKHSNIFFTANVSFSSCRSLGGSGGAMNLFDVKMNLELAQVHLDNCSAQDGGGLSIVQSNVTQSGGQLQLHHCSASDRGGGFFLARGKFEVGGTILVNTCTATSGGGGIFLEDHMQFHVYKDITFSNCRQVGAPSGFGGGGGLEVHNSDMVQSGGNVLFLVIAKLSSCFWCCPLKHRLLSQDVFTFACVCHSILSVGSIGAKVQELAEQLMSRPLSGNKMLVHSRLPIALPIMVREVEVLLSQIRILSSFVERCCSWAVHHHLTEVASTSGPTLP